MDISKLELTIEAEKAFYQYLALPDADAIASRMKLAESARDAACSIEDAKAEAWRIRLEMASGWRRAVLARVHNLASDHVGKIRHEIGEVHPLTGPLYKARYPNGILEHTLDKARAVWAEADAKRARKAATKSLKGDDPQSNAAKATNEKKERKRMKKSSIAFLRWAIENNEDILNSQAVMRFPKPNGISLKRVRELLGSLTLSLKHKSVKDEVLVTIKRNGFPNATRRAVTECLAILQLCKKNVGG
jgi:hypothetical protein